MHAYLSSKLVVRGPSESRKRERVAALSAHAKLIIEYTQACNTLLKEELFMHNNTHTLRVGEQCAARTQTQPLYLYMHTRRENNKYRVESEPREKHSVPFLRSPPVRKAATGQLMLIPVCVVCSFLIHYFAVREYVYASAEREREKTGRGQSVSTSTTAHFLYEHGGQHFGGISMIFSLFTSLERARADTYIHTASVCERET